MIKRLSAAGVDEVACLIDFGVEHESVLSSLHHLNILKERTRASEESIGVDLSLPGQIARYGITHLQCTPSMARMLLYRSRPPDGLHSLRSLMIGGEALPPMLASQLRKSCAAKMINMYGPTETTVWSMSWPVDDARDTVAIGRPILNTQIRLLNGRGQQVPVKNQAEVCIGGAGVARGYLDDPELTAQRFAPDEFSNGPGYRLYRTGDIARYTADGNIEYLGRSDHQVKIRGYRIELGEIESVLSQHPAVELAVAVAREDEPGHRRLVAYFSAREAVEARELREFIRSKLPEQMVPSDFVRLDKLPLTANGKIDRRALPKPDLKLDDKKYVAPGNEIEEILTRVWAELLRLEKIGVNDNFFELGGDSILSIQVIWRAREAGLHLTPRQFFEHQTIAELARVATVAAHIEPDQELVTAPFVLTPIQQAFFEWRLTEPDHFNQSIMLELKPEVDSLLLEQAARELLMHHDALRLRFRKRQDEWFQSYGELTEKTPFWRVDLSEFEGVFQQAALQEDLNRQQASLDITQGELVRAVEYEMGGAGRFLLLVIHHLVIDGISWRILLEDLERAYQQLVRAEAVKLPPRTTSLRQWVQRLDEYSRGEEIRREAEYWAAEGWNRATTDLPTDEQIGENTVGSVDSVSVWLTVEETTSLVQEVPAVYNTQINDLLLTALALAYRRWSGERWLSIEMEGHGREYFSDEVDLSRTVGWFTSLFPVRLSVDSPHPGEALKQIKEQLRAMPNRGLGYGLLRYLGGDESTRLRLREMAHPQISFNYLGQFDQILNKSSLFNSRRVSGGPTRSPLNERQHLLEINGMIVEGRMRIDLIYSENIHRRITIEELASYFTESMRALIDHCQSPQAGGYTPSDFPDANLTQEQLERIIAQVGRTKI
jgi:non-ribosomal peptide synthase protein (TIGR01720 family)